MTATFTLFTCTVYRTAGLPGFDQIIRSERPLAPRTDRGRVSGADSLRSLDRRQHSIWTGKRHVRGAYRSCRPSQRSRLYQGTAKRNAFYQLLFSRFNHSVY